MIIPIFKTDLVSCELDDSLPVLKHTWHKAPQGEEFKKNLLNILESFKSLRGSYASLAWLADTTELGELDEEIERWLDEVWQELLFKKAQVRIHAVVLGPNIFADYPMEKFKMEAEQKFRELKVSLGVFSNVDDAYAWMKARLAEN
jgi:hypothetical protein